MDFPFKKLAVTLYSKALAAKGGMVMQLISKMEVGAIEVDWVAVTMGAVAKKLSYSLDVNTLLKGF